MSFASQTFLAVISLILLIPRAALAQKIAPDPPEDALFEQVFKRPQSPQGNQRLTVSWSIDGQFKGRIPILLEANNRSKIRINSTILLDNLKEVARPEVLDKLQAGLDKEKNIAIDLLRENGLKAIFDDRKLQLFIEVPPAQRKVNVLSSQSGDPDAANAILPSRFSGYLTVRGGEKFVFANTGNSSNSGRQPLNLNFDTAINWNGWVLEGNLSFVERASPEWKRGNFRIVHDDIDRAVTYAIGDLGVPTVGYQLSKPLLGLSIARNYSLQPYLITRPVSQYEFFLENPSTVEVFVNGKLLQTLQLQAGQQDIRNLTLSSGVNDVQLEITDNVGRVQRLDFSNAIASSLLAPNAQQFAYIFGFPTITSGNGTSYDFTSPTIFAAYRQGINNTLSMGGYLQADLRQQIIGIEGALATTLGNISWDMALSNAEQLGIGLAARLGYEFIKSGETNPLDQSFGFTLEHRSANFLFSNLSSNSSSNSSNNLSSNSSSSMKMTNPSRLDFTANYRQKLFWEITSGLNFRCQLGRDRPDSYQIGLNLNKSLGNGFSISLNLSELGDGIKPKEQKILIGVTWSGTVPQTQQTLQAAMDITNKDAPTTRASWTNSSPNLEGIGMAADIARNPSNDSLTGKLNYRGYRGEFSLSQNASLNRNGQTTNTTQLDFGKSLVFVDGYWGISRPVTGSFVLVAPHPTLQGRVIGLNPNAIGGNAAQIEEISPAVLPDLSPYQVSKIRIAAQNLPVGYDLGQTNYAILPTYKSGTAIRIGTDATIFLRGTLRNNKDEPLSQLSGEFISLSDPKWTPLQIFTNKAGKFVLKGIKPGRYELKMFNDPPAIFSIDIPEGKTGVYDLGAVRSLSDRAPILNGK
ncbi:MAG: fimbria/pilus outer membrane usher protein [Pseudanabaena sp.]|jgi:outer membrane usher protein